MRSRRVPASLVWLAILVAAAIGVAVVAGATLYWQTRHAARVRADAMTGGDGRRGRIAIVRHQCGACHVIPGIDGATGQVGPDLTEIATRTIIAGKWSNDPDTLARFIAHPQRLRPGGAMPELGVTPGEACDIAAYLYAR